MLIEAKIEKGVPLSFEEGLVLFNDFDLHELACLADSVGKKRHGDHAYYVLNAHLNPTNICRIGCPLCAFAVKEGDPRAYVLEPHEIRERVRHHVQQGITQLHIVSSVHPNRPYQWYRDIIASIHAEHPALHLKAWTAVEIAAFAQNSGQEIRDILLDLKSVGLGSMPGGGAEIFDTEVRKRIAPAKIAAELWLEVHRTAHQIGLSTNASMLFGHLETRAHRVDHLVRLRLLQEETGGFDCFVPLVFHSARTGLDVPPLSPQEILRTIAISRLMLPNFEHIKAYWVTLGESLAQVALSFGADDFDGTIFEERIHHEAGSSVPSGLSVERIQELIRSAKRIPVLQ